MRLADLHFALAAGAVVMLAGNGAAADLDPVAAKARDILKENCYRCHGENGENAGRINYVLDVPKLVQRGLIKPGDERGSRLLRKVVRGEMPLENDGVTARKLPDDQIRILVEWVRAGAPDIAPPEGQRAALSPTQVIERIRDDLKGLPADARPFARYFTLTHLYNAGYPSDQLQTYRLALAKLVNSLSWEKEPVQLQQLNKNHKDETIYRVDLRRLGWTARTWDRILAFYPYGVRYDTPAEAECFKFTMDQGPYRPAYVRGDWFVMRAAQPPLYHDILALPETEQELERKIGIDVLKNSADGNVLRAGFNNSRVSNNNRLIERYRTPFGAYWKSYDFATSVDHKNLFLHPLGPGGKNPFQHDGGEIIFNLPNGLQAYLLVDDKGKRLNDVDNTNIVRDAGRPNSKVVNGLSCMSCHLAGMIEKQDQVRRTVQTNLTAYRKNFTQAEIDLILALYADEAKLQEVFDEDSRRFGKTMGALGAKVDDSGRVIGSEPIAGLVLLYEAELDQRLAAAEAGLTPEQFLKALEKSEELGRALGVLKAPGGTVKRDLFEDTLPKLVRASGGGVFLEPGESPKIRVQPILPAPPRELVRFIFDHKTAVTGLALAARGTESILATRHGATVTFRSLSNGRELAAFAAAAPGGVVAFSPDGQRLALGDYKKGAVSVYDCADFKAVKLLWQKPTPQGGSVQALALSRDTVAAGDSDGNLVLWEASAGQERKRLAFAGRTVGSLSISADGKLGVVGRAAPIDPFADSPPDHSDFLVFDPNTGATIKEIKRAGYTGTLSPGDPVLATHRGQFFHPRSGEKIKDLALGKEKGFAALAFSPRGRMLATGAATGTLTFWDVESGQALTSVASNPARLSAVAFAPDSRYLASHDGLFNQRVLVWDLTKMFRTPSAAPGRPLHLADFDRLPKDEHDDTPAALQKYFEKYRPAPKR